MTISHHPDDATLLSCAAGSQPEAFAAVLAAHLSMCPRCAVEAHKLVQIGAVLFDSLAPVPVGCAPPVITATGGETEAGSLSRIKSKVGETHFPLAWLIGRDLDKVPWRRLGPGIWHCPLKLSEGAKGDLRLFKVAPGQALPEHGHGGAELTLVLRGSYRDEIGCFGAGDVADLDEDVEHRPVADSKEGCVCLMATEAKARFKGLIARLVQVFTGI